MFKDVYYSIRENCADKYFEIRAKYSLLGVVIFSMMANGFAYFNLFPKHDSVNHLFLTASDWEIRLGRYWQVVYAYIRGQITAPWLNALLAMFFLWLTIYLLCDIFCIRDKIVIFLLGGFLSANVAITELCDSLMYIYDICMASLMLSVLGVWIVHKNKNILGMLMASVAFWLSIGLYQAYIIVAVVLIMVLFCNESFTRGKKSVPSIIYYVGAILLGIIEYFVAWRLVMWKRDLQAATGYNTISNLSNVTIDNFLLCTEKAYLNFVSFFFGPISAFLGGENILRCSTMLLFLLACFSLVKKMRRDGCKFYHYVLCVAITILYPLVTLSMNVLMGMRNIDFLSAFGVMLFQPILLIIICSCNENKGTGAIIRGITILLAAIILFSNIQFSNGAYTTSKVKYDRTLSVVSRVLSDMDVNAP